MNAKIAVRRLIDLQSQLSLSYVAILFTEIWGFIFFIIGSKIQDIELLEVLVISSNLWFSCVLELLWLQFLQQVPIWCSCPLPRPVQIEDRCQIADHSLGETIE